jgi:hypothetical protein
MDGERPDHHVRLGKAQPLPAIAAIGAAIRLVLRAGKDFVRIVRPNQNRMHFGVCGQAVFQPFLVTAVIAPAEQAAVR